MFSVSNSTGLTNVGRGGYRGLHSQGLKIRTWSRSCPSRFFRRGPPALVPSPLGANSILSYRKTNERDWCHSTASQLLPAGQPAFPTPTRADFWLWVLWAIRHSARSSPQKSPGAVRKLSKGSMGVIQAEPWFTPSRRSMSGLTFLHQLTALMHVGPFAFFNPERIQ